MFGIGDKEQVQLGKVNLEEQIVSLQNQKDSMNNQLAIKLNEMQMLRNQMQTQESTIKSEEKRNKIKGELIKQLMGQGGGFNGQNVLNEQVPQEEDARGLPLIERLNNR